MSKLSRWVFVISGWFLADMAMAAVNHAAAATVVQIRGVDPQGRMYFGSGVVTGPGTVVTNCHVVRGGGKIAIFRGAESYPVNRERIDVERDLCLLDAPGIKTPRAQLGRISGLKSGQPLYFYGYPRALGISFSEGAINALHSYLGSRIIETSAFFTLGGSGGGLFDRKGKLVGLATFLAPGHSGGYYAIPSEWIASVKARPLVEVAPLQGLSFWEDPAQFPAFLNRPGH